MIFIDVNFVLADYCELGRFCEFHLANAIAHKNMDRAAKDPSPETIEVLSTSRWNCYDDDNEILDATGLDLFSPDEASRKNTKTSLRN